MTAQCGCGASTGDGTTLCRACTTRLAADLNQVTWLERELDTALARQTAYGDRAGGRSAEHPLPYDPRASEAAWVLRDTLTNVARALGPQPPANRPQTAGDGPSPSPSPSGWTDPLGTGVSAARIARSLAQRLDTIRRHPEAYLLADEVHAAVNQARRIIDAPANRTVIPVGKCPEPDCGGEVRAHIPADGRPPHMTCTGPARHRYEPHQWTRAGRRILALRDTGRISP